MNDTEQLQVAEKMVNIMLGDQMISDGKGGQVKAPGRLVSSIRDQLIADVQPKLDDMAEDISTMREGLAKSPPSKRETHDMPPWDPMAKTLGIPDPNWYNPDASGVALDGKFESFKDFCWAVVNRYMNGVQDDRLRTSIRQKSMMAAEEMTGQELQLGGALVPEEFRPRLLMMGLQATSIRRLATVLPMGSLL